jgi:hypothetical protein
MVCYVVPTAAAIAHFIMRRNITSLKGNTYHLWLSFLLGGGAIFGLVDHFWNGELFLTGEYLLLDIMLGVSITFAIVVIWAILITIDKTKVKKHIKV